MQDKKVENLMRRLGNLIRERWWIVVITVFIGVGLAYGATNFMDREYSASVLIFANSNSGDNDSSSEQQLTSADVSLVNQLIADYRMFATSNTIVNEVNSKLSSNNMSTISARKISVASRGDSRAFTITVNHGDPNVCYTAVEYLAESLKNTIKDYLNMDNVDIIDHATVPTEPISPNVKLVMLFGGFLGLFVGIAIMYIIFLLDRAIKTVEDFESYFNIPVLGIIPAFDKMQVESKISQSTKPSSKNKTKIIYEKEPHQESLSSGKAKSAKKQSWEQSKYSTAPKSKGSEKKPNTDEPEVKASSVSTVDNISLGASGSEQDSDRLLREYLNQAEDILSDDDFNVMLSQFDGREDAQE